MQLRSLFTLGSVAALFLLSGCNTTGKSNSVASEPGATGAVSPASSTNGADSATASAATDATTLRSSLPIEPNTLDPACMQDIYAEEVALHTFEGLTRFNDKNQIEPCLAQKWEVSPDGLTYTFHLRDGVTFQNGRPFEAADVKYSWERAVNPHTDSAVAASYLDGIVGLKEIVAGKSTTLPGVVVVDAHTLKVTLDRPRAYFLGMLTMSPDFVVCKEAVEKTDSRVTAQSFVGTGPFKLDSYKPGQQFIFVANPTYWGGKPKLDRVEMPILLDPETTYNNYITNKLDVFVAVPISRYVQDHAANKLSGEYRVSPTASFGYLIMQPERQPAFAKKEVRQAFAYAIDRAEIVRVAFKNVPKVATGILPPEMPDAGPTPPQISYDPAKARALLAQAGYPGGKGFPALTLNYIQKNPDTAAEALIIRRNLHDNLGIEVNVQEREGGQYFKDEQKHTMEFFIAGWVADYLDPQDFLSMLFGSTATLDFSGYKNPEFDALCRQADALSDDKQRAALYGKAHAMLMDDLPVIPILFGPRITLIKPNVQGWRENLLYILPNAQTTKN